MRISNEKHAAVILKCLPRATADRFLAALDADSCSNVIHLMEHVEVTTEKLKAAIALLESERTGRSTTPDQAGSQLGHGGPNASNQQETPFAFLTEVDTPVLLSLFNQEQPRNSATVLSTLPKKFASTILRGLDPTKRVQTIRHLASLKEPDEKEIAELRFSLRLRIQKLLKSPNVSDANSTVVDKDAEVTKVASKVAEASVNEPVPYATLHELSKLSNKQIKKLLKRIDTSHLAPALKTLPIHLQRKVLRNMASKPAAIVSKEIVDVRVDEKHRIERSSRSVARAIKELKKK